MVAPGIFRHKKIVKAGKDLIGRLGIRVLFVGMITEADDYGYGDADPTQLLCDHFPRVQDISETEVLQWRTELYSAVLIDLSETEDGSMYYRLLGWDGEQTLRKEWKRVDTYKVKFESGTVLCRPVQQCDSPVQSCSTSQVKSSKAKSSKEREAAKKPRPSPPEKYQDFIDWWIGENPKYVWDGKHGKELKRLLTAIGFDELKRRCQLVLDGKALGWMKKPISFMQIGSQINSIGGSDSEPKGKYDELYTN